MLIETDKTICLIGFPESTITQEAEYFMSKETKNDIIVMSPQDFLEMDNKDSYQYGVAFTLDIALRKKIISIIQELNLDCITYIHDSVVCYTDNVESVIGKGSFVAPNSTVLMGAKIGEHCIIETYCLISHYAELKNNVILHSGSMIAGKTTIGENSMFNFKAAALNALNIGSDIEVGAASTVTKSISDPGVYIGTPARRLRDRIDFKDKHDF
jgi:acetyltransferase-like isoleucine patch superfamily enzyme